MSQKYDFGSGPQIDSNSWSHCHFVGICLEGISWSVFDSQHDPRTHRVLHHPLWKFLPQGHLPFSQDWPLKRYKKSYATQWSITAYTNRDVRQHQVYVILSYQTVSVKIIPKIESTIECIHVENQFKLGLQWRIVYTEHSLHEFFLVDVFIS